MRSIYVASIVLLSLSVPSLSRIGETMDQAVKRYGRVVSHENIHGAEVYSFEKNGFHILANFHSGKIDRIVYNSYLRQILTDEEIATFLKANIQWSPNE